MTEGRPGTAISPSGKRVSVNFVDRVGGKVSVYLRKPPYNWYMSVGWAYANDAEAIANFEHRGWSLEHDQ